MSLIKLTIVGNTLEITNGITKLNIIPLNNIGIDSIRLYEETPIVFFFNNQVGKNEVIFEESLTRVTNSLGEPFTLNTFTTFFTEEIKKNQNTNSYSKSDYYLEVQRGNIIGESIVNKFGRNAVVGASLVPVCIGGNYRTPIATTTLEILSTDAEDGAGGLGARSMNIQGLDADYNVQSEIVEMDGVTPVTLANSYTRIFRMYVETSGTYASQTSGSHYGELILRESGAGDEWARITLQGAFGIGQSQIGAYSIPKGFTGYLLSKHISVEANKPTSLYFFKRENIDNVVAPFQGAMRLFEENDGIQIPFAVSPKAPLQTLPEMTDVGFLAKVGIGTASISVDFQIHLIKNT